MEVLGLNLNAAMNKHRPGTVTAQTLFDWLENDGKKLLLVDVREDVELDIAPFPYEVIHLPLSKFPIWSSNLQEHLPLNQTVVVICHAGIRSWEFATWLLDQNTYCDVWNLDGGIDAWSVSVDQTVPRY